MAVEDGQRVNAAVTNAAYISRTVDSGTIAKVALERTLSGPNITDAQIEINKSRSIVSQSPDVEDDGSITTNEFVNEFILVKSDGGEILAADTPLGTIAPFDGKEVTLMGISEEDSVKISPADVAKGCAMNGSIVLRNYVTITFKYIQQLDRYVEISRNFL